MVLYCIQNQLKIRLAEPSHLSHIKTPNYHQRQSVWAQRISEILSTFLFPPVCSSSVCSAGGAGTASVWTVCSEHHPLMTAQTVGFSVGWFLSELAQNLFFLYDLSHLTDYLTEISFYVSMNQDLVYPNANPLQSGIQTFWRKNRFLFLWSCLEWKLKCMSLQRAAKSSKLLWDSNKRKKDEIVMHISVLLSPFSKILNANVQKSKYLLQNVLRCVLHLKSIYFCSYIIGGCI